MNAFLRALLLCALVWAAPGCQHHGERQQPPREKKPEGKATPAPTPKPLIPNMNGDMNFQAFLGRLRTAVHQRDHATLQSMMESDFGWRWDEAPAGETAFTFWDQHNLWPELEKLLSERFSPREAYMVSPPAFVSDATYRGYRCGVRQVNGSWRFSYFITGEDVLP